MNPRSIIPNGITSCNLLCGCMAAYLATQDAFIWAFIAILTGAFFDFFDGMTARKLGVSGPLGVQLDSLADDITFGLAPSAILFSVLKEMTCPDWLAPVSSLLPYVAFIMAAFSALRLAKFNLDERQTTSFIGLPTPANALFWGSLVVGCHDWLVSSPTHVLGLVIGILLFSYLLVAEIPLFALKFKNLTWADNYQKYIFLLGCLPCFLLGYSCFAAIIVWYVLLAVLMPKK